MGITQKLLISARLVARWAVRGRADRQTNRPRRVLIIQASQLGDMVCTTPMFRAVKHAYPECRLTVLGTAGNRWILKDNPDVDEYLEVKADFPQALKEIRSRNFDFACMTSPSFTGLALIYLAGVPLIAAPKIKNGFSPNATRLYRAFLCLAIAVPHRMGSYAPGEYLRLLEPIGIVTTDTTKYLGYTAEAGVAVQRYLSDHGITDRDLIVGISPSAGNKIKLWRRDRFARVADYLYEKYHAKVLLLGGKNDVGEVEEMVKNLAPTTRAIANTSFSLDELKACIARLSLFISVDTGPIYIAEAFNVPTIDITGPIDEHEQPPIGKFHRVVVPQHRRKPELFVMNARSYDAREARRQADDIQVADVIHEVDSLLAELREMNISGN